MAVENLQSPAPTVPRRRRFWLRVFQILWVVAAVLTVQLLLLGVRPAYEQLTTPCFEAECADYRLTAVGLAALERLGWTPHGYAVYNIILVFVVTLISLGVSVVIFRSRPQDPMALYTAVTLLLGATFLGEYMNVFSLIHPAFELVAIVGYILALLMFVSLFYIFPDGHFVPRWSRWAFLLWIALPVVAITLVFMDLLDAVLPYGALLTGSLLITCLIAPVIRYRRATAYQRQQLKWALFGLIQLAAVMVLFVEVGPLFFPAIDTAGTLPDAIDALIETISMSLLAISIGFAVLRYRLWDVNLLLNRTLVYVPLTSILAVVYTIAIRVSENLFVNVAGEQPQAVAVFTTVILTTTFSPIRNMLQSTVDRYFKEPPDPLKPLRQLEQDVHEIVQVLHHPQVLRRMVEHVVTAAKVEGGALILRQDGVDVPVYATPDFDAEAQADPACTVLVLHDENELLGKMLLSPRREGITLEPGACDAVTKSAVHILQSLRLVSHLTGTPRA